MSAPDESTLEQLRAEAERGDPEGAFELGHALEDLNRLAEAESAYRRAADLGHADARRRLARVLALQGRLDEAEPLYREALDEGDVKAAAGLGTLLTQRGRPEDRGEAEALHQRAIAGGIEDALLNYATLLAHWPGREEEAERMYERALAAGITNSYHNLGMMLREQGRVEEAEQAFHRGIEAGDSWAWYGLGLLLGDDEDRLDEAENALRTALAEGYDPGSAHSEIADLYLKMDRPEDAEREYLAAIEAGETGAHLDLGILYQDLDRYEEAEKQYLAAIAAGIPAAHTSYGNLLDDALDRPAEAEEQYRLAIEAGSDEANATYNLAVCIGQQGREAEAAELYRRSSDLGFAPARWFVHWDQQADEPEYTGKDVWIGVADLAPLPGSDPFDGGVGAFGPVVGLADDEEEFRRLVVESFAELPVKVDEIEDVEPFVWRVINFDVDDELFKLALQVSPTMPVLHGEYLVYMSEDE